MKNLRQLFKRNARNGKEHGEAIISSSRNLAERQKQILKILELKMC
jgi:hypothetical protein